MGDTVTLNDFKYSNRGYQSMNPSEVAKDLGAKSLTEVAVFYSCTTEHLRNLHKRNLKAFLGMVSGYLLVGNL
ncbi:hypothetical protein ACS91_22840 [Vibrio parahaemolyticus]|nr:hypothetical protein ACS91_22840 [Vibrio parahaemolyticus]